MKHVSRSARFRRAAFFLAAMAPCLVHAARLDDVMARLNREERRQLGTLSALSPAALDELEDVVEAGAIRRDVESLMASTPLSLGARADDAPGPQAWLEERLAPIPGLMWLGELRERVPVPVALDQAQTLAPRQDRATHMDAGGKTWPLFPFWPNGALPNLAPESGLKGPLLYVGAAEWSDLKGLDPRGAIALMDFKGGRNWNRLMDLGALAVVVLEDDYVGRPLAERFFANTPLPLPRYFVDRETGAALKDLAGTEATVRGGNWWENRTARSLFAWLPPQPAGEKNVSEADLLERIAAQFGLDASDLLQENRLATPVLKAGQILDIPGRVETYTVASRDLLQRLAREWMVSPDQLLKENAGVDPELPPGSRLAVPALAQPVVVLARLESVSAVPGLPHGATAAANISVAVRLIELAAKMPPGTRRRGLLVGFLEGDQHGGRASRRFLETLLLDEGKILPAALESNRSMSEEDLFARYLEVEGWLRGENAALSEKSATWFGEDWLLHRLNGFRVELAEKRVEAILRLQTELPAGERVDAEAMVASLDQRILDLVKLRQESLQAKGLSPLERAATFLQGVDALAVERPGVPGLSRAAMENRFFEEVAQERSLRELTRVNRETVRRVVGLVRAGEPEIAPDKFRQAWWLDLSGGSASLEVSPIKDYRDQAGITDANRSTMVERMDRVHAFAARQAGWTDQWAFIGNNVQADFPLLAPVPPPSYAEFWGGFGVGLLGLRAANDPRTQVDTPLDIPEQTRFDNLSLLARTSLMLLRVNLESAADGTFAGKWKSKPYSRLVGATTRFNIRSGIDAKDPVPHAMVHYPAIREVKGLNADLGFHNTATFMGSRLGVMQFSLLNGRYALPLEAKTYKALFDAHAYSADPVSGLFGLVMEGGQIGTQKQTYSFALLEGQDAYKNLILHALYPLVVSAGVDPFSTKCPILPMTSWKSRTRSSTARRATTTWNTHASISAKRNSREPSSTRNPAAASASSTNASGSCAPSWWADSTPPTNPT
jgi:LysM repeat protein